MTDRGDELSETAFYADLIGSAMDAIVATDESHNVVLFNRAAETMFEWTAAEILGRPLNILIPERFRQAHTSHVKEFGGSGHTGRNAGQLGVVKAIRKDGQEFPVEASISRSVVGGRRRFAVILRDVTARLKAEEAVRERLELEDRLGRIAAVAPGVLYMFRRRPDGSMSFPYVSSGISRIFGLEPAVLAESALPAFSQIHPEDLGRILESTEESARTLGVWRQEFRVFHAERGTLWIQAVSTPMREVDGSIVWNGFLVDVTETRQLQAQLQQAIKMEAVGQLAGGIAHDFNNLLTVIVGYCELLQQDLAGDPAKSGFVTHILQAGERAASLTRQLLAFSRKQVLAPRVIDLTDVVTRVETMLRRLIGEDVILTTVFRPGAGMVKVDPGQMEQVIINLAVNARDAMPAGGSLTIEISDVVHGEDYTALHPYCRPGRYTLLAVTDTGTGMTPEVKARAFEPFFTTKETGKGTGLGLATVFGIVKQSDGYVELYSELGVGSCFKIYFPVVNERGSGVEVAQPAQTTAQGTETVLIIEDEAEVRQVAVLALEGQGYTVLDAGDGPTALELSARYDGPIHLIVADAVLPGMSGSEAAARLVSGRPEAKVLFMSGYIDDAVVRHGIITAHQAFINKPFSPLEFARKVRSVLDQPIMN